MSTFSLSPAIATNTIIDYTMEEGRKSFEATTLKLLNDKYICGAEDRVIFLDALKERAQETG